MTDDGFRLLCKQRDSENYIGTGDILLRDSLQNLMNSKVFGFGFLNSLHLTLNPFAQPCYPLSSYTSWKMKDMAYLPTTERSLSK